MEPLQAVLNELKALRDPVNVAGMARFGIRPQTTVYGVSIVPLRQIAKRYKKDHVLAQDLWNSGIHEARILAAYIADPKQITEAQLEAWVSTFDSWDICDQCCGNLFDKTPFAYAKAVEWAGRPEEFVKRAGFVLMTQLAVHDKRADDQAFIPFFAIIEREAGDERNFVKKAVNWALRQIGKRNQTLNALAIETGQRIRQQDSKAAGWVAGDALRELTSTAIQTRLRGKL